MWLQGRWQRDLPPLSLEALEVEAHDRVPDDDGRGGGGLELVCFVELWSPEARRGATIRVVKLHHILSSLHIRQLNYITLIFFVLLLFMHVTDEEVISRQLCFAHSLPRLLISPSGLFHPPSIIISILIWSFGVEGKVQEARWEK